MKKVEQEGEPKNREEGKKRSSETEDHEKQRLATLKRLKRGDDNELERNLRLEKVVASNQLRLAVETEEERRAKLENDAATKRVTLARETNEERTARLEKMVAIAQVMLALIKGVVDVGVVLPLRHILKSWQLCLLFKLDVLTKYAPRTERNIDHELLSVSLILLYMCLITYTFIILSSKNTLSLTKLTRTIHICM